MPADARLALAQDLGEILDVQLGRRQQRQNTQARRLARRAQGRKACALAKPCPAATS